MKKPTIRKLLQALYYLQSKATSADKTNRVYLLKMLFMTDRYHLRHFGITATNDNYYAMKLGPVASKSFDILKNNYKNINSAEIPYLSDVVEISEHDVLINPQEQDELSESFREALDFALREFGSYGWSELSEISHCYPEWKKHEKDLPSNTRMTMNIQDFFDNPDNDDCFAEFGIKEDPFKEDEEFLALSKEEYAANLISA